MATRELVIDQWAALSYKPGWSSGHGVWTAPLWVGEDNKRRIDAYMLLASYVENTAREWLDISDDGKRLQHREYGDASLIVETVVAAILGVEPKIFVEGAVPPPNAPKDEKADARAVLVNTWLKDWDDKERPFLSITEFEEDAVGLGDGIIIVSWDSLKGRPTLDAYDPGFYFPVLDDANPREYPTKIHIAWEFEVSQPNGEKNKFIRRITYQLTNLPAARTLPWNTEPTDVTCLLTNLVVPVPGEERFSVDALSLSDARYELNADGVEIRDLDLNIDFIPILHMPNTIARKQHFGKSSLALILQLLDELASIDTDLALSARTTGFPPVSVDGTLQAGADGRTIDTYGPGTVFSGKVNVVDTSTSLDALLKYLDAILKRLSVNGRLPETVLGRGKPTDFKSGYDRSLSFGPMISMIRKMRMVRDEKYPLLFKFVCRFAMQNGEITAGDLPRMRLAFGRFLPQDRQNVVETVRTLLESHAISVVTAVRMLMEEGGLPIEDAVQEILDIQAGDFAGAQELHNATGSKILASEYLQLELPKGEVLDDSTAGNPTVSPKKPPAPKP